MPFAWRAPFFVQSHSFNEGNGKPTRREALGSINVLREEVVHIVREIWRAPSPHHPDGSEELIAPVRLNPPYGVENFSVDPVAFEIYRELLNELRQRGVKIIFLRAPYFGPVYDRDRKPYESFYERFSLRRPGEPVIDFGAPKYASMRENLEYWNSVGHLSHDGAIQAAEDLNAELHSGVPAIAGVQLASSSCRSKNGQRDHSSPDKPRSSSSTGIRLRSRTQAILRPLNAEAKTGAESAIRPSCCN